jgi:proline iminopeptidase
MLPTSPHNPRYDDPKFRLGFARLVTHYWSNGHFLPRDGVLLEGAGHLSHVPGLVIQGTLDLGNLVGTPWQLTAAWPGSELQLVDDAGHGGSDTLLRGIVTATDRFASSNGNEDA